MLGGLLHRPDRDVFWSAYFSIEYKDVAAFSILAIVLDLLPTGLLGRPEVEKVRISCASTDRDVRQATAQASSPSLPASAPPEGRFSSWRWSCSAFSVRMIRVLTVCTIIDAGSALASRPTRSVDLCAGIRACAACSLTFHGVWSPTGATAVGRQAPAVARPADAAIARC